MLVIASAFATFILYTAAPIRACVAQNPELCDSIAQNEFFIGSWLAQEPFVENSRADTLLLEIDGVEEAVQVLEISGSFASFLFKEREGSAGAEVAEHYQYQPDSN
jgi:preprotein translocase subunit SecD